MNKKGTIDLKSYALIFFVVIIIAYIFYSMSVIGTSGIIKRIIIYGLIFISSLVYFIVLSAEHIIFKSEEKDIIKSIICIIISVIFIFISSSLLLEIYRDIKGNKIETYTTQNYKDKGTYIILEDKNDMLFGIKTPYILIKDKSFNIEAGRNLIVSYYPNSNIIINIKKV